MNKDCLIDYSSYIGFKALGSVIRILPKRLSLSLGERLGDLLYFILPKPRATAYANLKTAFGGKFGPKTLRKVCRHFFRNFGQNLIEIFFIPFIDKEYISKYINISGLDNIRSCLKKGRGAIVVGIHEGSWELSNILAANLGFPFRIFVRQQGKFRRIEALLNSYRTQRGCKIVQRKNQTRQLIESIRNNEAIGMTLDQGGRSGEPVKFFGKEASMASGAVRMSLKYGVPILPAFYARIKGPYTKIFLGEPFEVKSTEDARKDIHDNLERLVRIFEEYIRMYPQEYLWSYKVWKYGREREVLILSDGKAGHLRQSEAVSKFVSRHLAQKGFKVKVRTVRINIKGSFSKLGLKVCGALSGKYSCQGCLSCVRRLLDKETYDSLISASPDIIISCGSNTAGLNVLLARESLGRSIVILKPPLMSADKFDLVIMPRHDNPARRKNVVVTEGALNLIDEQYLEEQSKKLLQSTEFRADGPGPYIGLLIGGDSKNFYLQVDALSDVIRGVKFAADKLNASILVTTSRRTPKQIEALLKDGFRDNPRCRLLVIANENNIPEAVGGILGLSEIIVTSPESISMISEAVNSKKYVLVFKAQNLSAKHRDFLDYFAVNKYIYLSDTAALGEKIEQVLSLRPRIRALRDDAVVSEAVKRIL